MSWTSYIGSWRMTLQYSVVFVLCPTSEFFTHMDATKIPMKCLKFWPILVDYFMTIEQYGLFGVPHLLWLGTFVYNGHLRGSITLTPALEWFTVEILPQVFTTLVCRGCDSPIFRMQGIRSYRLCGYNIIVSLILTVMQS